MTVMAGPEITGYVERVRAALADLPPQTRDELTEDLAEHLAEVAAEGEGSLVERLGEPEAYAEALRVAAGAATPSPAPNLDRKLATAVLRLRTRVRHADRRLGPLLGTATATDFLRPLRPAWWLLRGYLVAMLITLMSTNEPFGLLPRLGGSTLAALLLLAACVAGSFWLGRRTATLSRWPRRVLGAGTGVLVVFALVGLVDLDQRGADQYTYYEPSSTETPYIRDLFVYDDQGRLLTGVRLFDQDGNPIRLGDPTCEDGLDSPIYEGDKPDAPPTYPRCPSAAPFVFGSSTPPSAPPTPAPPTPAPASVPTPPSTPVPPSAPATQAPAVTPPATPAPPSTPQEPPVS